MLANINLGNKKDSIKILSSMKCEKRPDNYDIRIHNSHITELNTVLGKKVFKKNALYIGSETLWEIMQDVGGKGKHHYHGLSPRDVYNALITLRYSKEIDVSYDDRYLIVTLATVFDDINIAVIVATNGFLKTNLKKKVNKIVTIYPYKKK